MAKRKSPSSPSKRERNREILFTALLKMSQNLKEERRILEDRVKYLNGIIYQVKKEQKFDSLKMNFLLGLKEREACVYKHRYENADDELADTKDMLSLLSQKNQKQKDPVVDAVGKGKGPQNKVLQDEVRRLKIELEKIQLEKKSEVTALLDEKNFIWNQYNKMESDFTERLSNNSREVELANEKMQALINKAEELECSNERLRTELAKMESDSSQKTSEMSRLLKEIEVLKSRLESETPVLRPCKATKGTSTAINDSVKTVDKASDTSNTKEKVSRAKRSAHKSTGGKAPKKQLCVGERSTSKRKADDAINIPPKLFTSSFKVPKLKPSSSGRR